MSELIYQRIDQLVPEFERLRQRYPAGFESSLVLPCLHRIQQEHGYVAESDISGLARYLAVPRIQIEEVLGHYTQLRRYPVARWHLQACRNVSCSMRGAEGLIEHLCRRLKIDVGQSSADGRYTLDTVECLGSCGTAPVLMVNDTYHENMNPERVDALLAEFAELAELADLSAART